LSGTSFFCKATSSLSGGCLISTQERSSITSKKCQPISIAPNILCLGPSYEPQSQKGCREHHNLKTEILKIRSCGHTQNQEMPEMSYNIVMGEATTEIKGAGSEFLASAAMVSVGWIHLFSTPQPPSHPPQARVPRGQMQPWWPGRDANPPGTNHNR